MLHFYMITHSNLLMLCYVRRDLLLEVNQEDVSKMSLRDIPRRIEQAARPITIKLERIVMEIDFLDVLRDPRKVSPPPLCPPPLSLSAWPYISTSHVTRHHTHVTAYFVFL
jgi:hypothetical protein